MVRRRTILWGKYELRETLGSGLQGKVKLALDTKTNEFVAIKVMTKCLEKKDLVSLNREVNALKSVDHTNIIRLREVVPDVQYPKKDGTFKPAVVVVLDLAGGGELLDFMLHTGYFPETIARTYFNQLMSGLGACHSAAVYHRDIKPENLLLDSKFQLKIADFGLSAVQDPSQPAWLQRSEVGTRAYMAPEVLARGLYDPAAADVWSCGVVLFILLAGFPPFQIANDSDWWFKEVKAGRMQNFWSAHERDATFSPQAKDLLSAMFTLNPSHRPTLPQLATHPWCTMSELSSTQLEADLTRRQKAVVEEKRKQRAAKQANHQRQMDVVDPFGFQMDRCVSAPPPPPP